jgi:hypothetical protein
MHFACKGGGGKQGTATNGMKIRSSGFPQEALLQFLSGLVETVVFLGSGATGDSHRFSVDAGPISMVE